MKKLFTILFSLLTAATVFANDGMSEISISGGWPTPVSIFTSGFANRVINNHIGEASGKIQIENPTTYGAFSLTYHRTTSAHFQIGAKLNWEYTGFDLYSTSDPDITMALGSQHKLLGQSATQMITAMVSMKFVYLDIPLVKLYSGIDIGGGCAIWKRSNMYSEPILNPTNRDDLNKLKELQEKYKDGAEAHFIPAFNLNLIGLHVGTFVYGLAEVNAGTDAIVKLGLGVKF